MQQDGNLIVNYLPVSYREAELYDLFVHYGSLLKVKVIYHKDSDDSMTYGFVRFQNPNDAIVAMSELNGREIFGKRIKVGFARPGLETSNCKLYVKRVPPSYTLDDVHKLFSQFGEILESRLLTDAKGHSRQVAFVQYTNRQDAEDAIMNLSGAVPPRGTHALIVKYATHPRQTPHGKSFQISNDTLQAKYQPNNKSPPPLHPPTVPVQSAASMNSSGYSTKIDHYLLTKPRSSDWTEPVVHVPQPAPLTPPPSTASTYLTTVTVSGVPPALDIMDFHFLSKYGKVLEGKMTTRDIQVIYPDGVPMNYQTSSGIIEFCVSVNSFNNFKSLLSLSGSMIFVEGHSIMLEATLVR